MVHIGIMEEKLETSIMGYIGFFRDNEKENGTTIMGYICLIYG